MLKWKLTNLTKQHIVNKINKRTGFSKNFSKKITEDIISLITEHILSGYFNLKNFGTFRSKYKKKRVGRNPKTNEKFIIIPRYSVSFIPSKKISEMLKNKWFQNYLVLLRFLDF